VYLNTSPAPDKYYLSDTSPAPEKLVKYLKIPFRRRRSIYTHFSGAGEVLIYTYLVPERPEKQEKYLYTPVFLQLLMVLNNFYKRSSKIWCPSFAIQAANLAISLNGLRRLSLCYRERQHICRI